MKKHPNRPIDTSVMQSIAINTALHPTALDTPERIMEYFRMNGFIKDGTCTDIEQAILQNPELELTFEDLGDADGYIMKIDYNRFRIAVNSRHHKNRQRFSMAHEYAHYQLHREQIDTKAVGEQILFRNSERNPIEYQANQLASELLMPKQEFLRQVREREGDVRAIADFFVVSPEAVRVRASQLGLGMQ